MKIIESFIKSLKKTRIAQNFKIFIKHKQIDFYNRIILPKLVHQKKEKKVLNVAFVVYNVSMWKYYSLYKAMENDSRFNPFIVLTPSPGKEKSIRDMHLKEMQKEFSELKYKIYPKIVWNIFQFDADFDADIIFLTQMYEPNFLTKELKKYLICYCPYGFPSTSSSKWAVDTFLHNIAWKEFQATQVSIDNTAKITYNKSKNRVLTGYVFGDELSKQNVSPKGIWKDTGKNLKRIIWAPHFSIDPKHCFHLSTFLEIYDLMFEIANEYRDTIQIAFKPHPFLYPKLCEPDFWGKEKTDLYYEKWKNLFNGQLENGAYSDLFASSDAIIHDCGSFTIEYLYTKKPAMYLINKIENREADSLGYEALSCYYHGTSRQSIESFITDVVINNNDPMSSKRNEFYEKYLKTKNNCTVADSIVKIIKDAL